MSNFLMVVPPEWSELTDAQAFIEEHSEAQILDLIARNEGWAAIEALLQDSGYLPADSSMVDFRMFRDGSANRIWYRLA